MSTAEPSFVDLRRHPNLSNRYGFIRAARAVLSAACMIQAIVECEDCGANTITDQYKGDRVLNCADCGKILVRDIGNSN